jgi:hypothetical protein
MRIALTLATLGLTVLSVGLRPAGSIHQVSPDATLVGAERSGAPIETMVPLTDASWFESVVLHVGAASHLAVGFERVLDEPLPPRYYRASPSPRRIVLTGLSLSDAMGALIAGAPELITSAQHAEYRFQWRAADGLLHVTPLSAQHTFLDTVLPEFRLSNQTVSAAMVAVHQALDPSYPDIASKGIGGSFPSSETDLAAARRRLDEYLALVDRRVTIRLTNATIRQILDAVASAHGSVSWVVRYRSLAGEYSGCQIAFYFPDASMFDTQTAVKK